MSDTLPRNSENPDALPVNERSSAFIDSAAFLNFVRLKSLVASQVGSGAIDGGEALNAPSAEENNAFAHPTTDSAIEAEIEPEDWDSLFGAIEERLRGTVDTLDSATTQVPSRNKLSYIKSVVLDCVSSLDALHTALRHDRGLQLTNSLNRDNADVRSASRPTSPNAPSRKN